MKKKLIILAFIVFLGLPSVSLAGSFVVSLVQGKTPDEAVQIIAEQVSGLLARVDVLEIKQDQTTTHLTSTDADIEKLKLENANLILQNENLKIQSGNIEKEQLNQYCSNAIKTVPKLQTYGENYDITKSIVRYYTMSKFMLDNQLNTPEYLKTIKKMVEESRPLYDEFIGKCPAYPQKDLPVKTAWCVLAEKYAKCSRNLAPLDPAIAQPTLYGEAPGALDKVLTNKFSEFSCETLLSSEVPNRDKYVCG